MGARRIFSSGEQIMGLGTKVLPAWSGVVTQGRSPAGSLGRNPQKPTISCENNVHCINNSSRPTERFAVATNAQNTLQHFQGGGGQVPLLLMPTGAHDSPTARSYIS